MVLLRCGAPVATFVFGRSLHRRDRRWRRGLVLMSLLPYLRTSLLDFMWIVVSPVWADLVLCIKVPLLLLRLGTARVVRTRLLSRPCMTVAAPLSAWVMVTALLLMMKQPLGDAVGDGVRLRLALDRRLT